MAKYKVGDIVRIVDKEHLTETVSDAADYIGVVDGMHKYCGMELEIDDIFTRGEYTFYKCIGCLYYWCEDWLEPAEKTKSAFKVGDVVRIMDDGVDLENCYGDWDPDMEQYVGRLGIIESIVEPTDEYHHYGYKLEHTLYIWDERLLKLKKINADREINNVDYLDGRVVCTFKGVYDNLTVGKIYEVKNGRMLDDYYNMYPNINSDAAETIGDLVESFEDSNGIFALPSFIKIVE